jgi:hypothetical protein
MERARSSESQNHRQYGKAAIALDLKYKHYGDRASPEIRTADSMETARSPESQN